MVGRTIWYNRDDTMLVVDFGSSSASHTFTSGFNLPGSASYVSDGSIYSMNGGGNVKIVSILLPGQPDHQLPPAADLHSGDTVLPPLDETTQRELDGLTTAP